MNDSALVSLVGAGPGHPGLLTLQAVECMRRADLIIYDQLVPPTLLIHARPEAEVVCVTALAAGHPRERGSVLQAVIAAARAGRRVVRLKGGDPSIFGRGGEEAAALAEAGIPFRVVPGITAALGAAAFAGIPLTHREYASGVALVTGHENPEKTENALDWAALARFPGTLVVYMGVSRLERIVSLLLEGGKHPDTPAAFVRQATQGDQLTLEAPLATLPAAVRSAGLTPPALVVIGPVVRLRSRLAWFESLPLFGSHVLVTRPLQQAHDLVERIVELGGVPIVCPTVEIREPASWESVDAALRELASYHWLVFTSGNGVDAFLGRLRTIGLDLRALGHLRLAAIGPATAASLRRYHLEADVVPPRYQSEDLAAALLEHVRPGERVLLARADRGRELLREVLGAKRHVDQVAVYSQVDAEVTAEARDRLRRGAIDLVTLTSSNIARAFLKPLDEASGAAIREGRTGLVSISPVTSEEVRRQGFEVAAEARAATMASLVEALKTCRAQRCSRKDSQPR